MKSGMALLKHLRVRFRDRLEAPGQAEEQWLQQ